MTNTLSTAPPQNRDAERALLGGILRDPEVLLDALAVVRPESLYFDPHRRILAAAAALAGRDVPIDLVTLHAELGRRGELADVGGAAYLAELFEAVPTGANALYHARLVRDAARLRGLIHAANEVLRDAYSPTGSAEELIAVAEQKLFALTADAGADEEPEPVGAVARQSLAALDDRIAAGEALAGLPVGYPELDRVLGGLRGGELVVLAARPSVGKTALALNVADRVARSGVPVLFFSLEQSRREIVERLLAMESGVPVSRMARAAELRRADLEALSAAGAGSALGARPIFIDDRSNATAARVAAVARRAHRRLGVRLVVIDYLGLMAPENPRDNQSQRIGTLALRTKQMARTLNVPVLLLAQLNRAVEDGNRRPRLSDLRDSGEIEQHADRVLFLHRESSLSADDPVWPLDVVIGKNRNGPLGDVRLSYVRPVLRFESTPVPC